jgi:hypothetical protein
MTDNPEILEAIQAVFKLAASNALAERMAENALEIRARATLALAVFMPHDEARRGLLSLVASDHIPARIRALAAEALRDWTIEPPAQG